MWKLLFAMAAILGLASCGAEPIWAPEEAVAAARYEHPGPTSVTLFTVLSTRSGAGAHAGLMQCGTINTGLNPWKRAAF